MSRPRLLIGISVFWLALSMLFDGVNTLVLPQRLLAVAGGNGGRATLLGLLSFAGLLFGLLVQPLAGDLSDRTHGRWGRRGMVALGLVLILAALVVFGLAGSLAVLFLGYLALQGATAVAQAAQQGFIPDLVPEQLRGTASGLKGLMDLGGALFGFALLGRLLQEGDARPAVVAIATVLVVAGLLTLVLVREKKEGNLPLPETGAARNPFHLDLGRHRAFAWAVAARFLFLLGTYAVGRFLLFFVADRLGLDRGQAAEQAGLLLSGLTLISVVASPLAGWAADRLGRRPLMLAGSGLSAGGVLLLAVARSEGQILACGGLMAVGSAAFAGANWAITADLVPRDEAARFFGLANAGTVGAAAAAGLFGLLVDWLSYLYQPLLPYLAKIKIRRAGSRQPKPGDVLLPEGFAAEVVTTGLNAPVHCTFDDQGFCYVAESGHKIDSPPRIIRVNVQTGEKWTYFEFPSDRWVKSGSLTGVCWHDGFLYVTNTDALSRIGPGGDLEDLVTGLPGLGDHQTNHPVVGPDQKIYFGQGSATNMGVVGADNLAFEWLARYPHVHDVPAEDVVLAGHNYASQNVLGDVTEKVTTGAFVPFGTETRAGQVIPGDARCSGSILRCNLDGSDLEVVAWGLRNPYSVAFHPDGRLFATEHGADERGARQILDDPDDFYAIEQGRWYGWPDFASGIRLDDPHWRAAGQGREPVLAEFPEANPPRPLVSFQTHAAANGMDFCRDVRFGFISQAFVACFGDLAPITTLKRALTPAGFKVARVNPTTGTVHDFAVNRIVGPASMVPHEGFERPSHCQFGPDGALYVVDWGVIKIAPERGAIRMPLGTGVLWRIRRSGELYGQLPPEPIHGPVYGLRYLLLIAGVLTAVAGIAWLLARLFKRR